jgi:SAM-dependent methyltransferase
VKDAENPNYIMDDRNLFDGEGNISRHQQVKYLPKLDVIAAHCGDPSELRVLDVGIGYGAWLRLLEQRGYLNLYGLDPFATSLAIAGRHTGAQLRKGAIEDEQWPFDEASFDLITCFDVVEHLEEPAVFFRRCRRYLRPAGLAMVTTPNCSIFYRMRSIPLIGQPDTCTTHIMVKKPEYWRRLVADEGYDMVCEWYGEFLSHLRLLPIAMNKLFRWMRIDHRRIRLLRGMEQSYCILLRQRD